MVVRQAGQAARSDGNAVIRTSTGEEFFLLRTSERVVHVPHHFDHGIICFRAGTGEEHASQWLGGHLDYLLGETDGRLMRLVAERMIVRQFGHLLCRNLNQTRLIEADSYRPETCKAFDIFLASVIIDIDALAVIDNHWPLALMRAGVGIRMQSGRNINMGEGIGELTAHSYFPP